MGSSNICADNSPVFDCLKKGVTEIFETFINAGLIMMYHRPKKYWKDAEEYFGKYPRGANPYDPKRVTGFDIIRQVDDEMGGYKSDPAEFKHFEEELDRLLDKR